jgi:hypothetical protein
LEVDERRLAAGSEGDHDAADPVTNVILLDSYDETGVVTAPGVSPSANLVAVATPLP